MTRRAEVRRFRFRNLAITLMPPNADIWCGEGLPNEVTGCPMMSTCGPPTTACDGYSLMLVNVPETGDELRQLLGDLRAIATRGDVQLVLATEDEDRFVGAAERLGGIAEQS